MPDGATPTSYFNYPGFSQFPGTQLVPFAGTGAIPGFGQSYFNQNTGYTTAPGSLTPGFNPALFGQFQSLLPPNSKTISNKFGFGAGAGYTNLQDIKGVQLADFLSSLQSQSALTPLAAALEQQLAGQIIPGQLQQASQFQNLEASLLGQSPLFGPQIQNFLGAQAGAFGGLSNLGGIQQNIGGLQAGIGNLLAGGLPEGISNDLQDALNSQSAAYNLQNTPYAAADTSKILGSSLAAIQSQLLGSYTGASGSLIGQGSQVLQDLFGASQLGIPGYGSLLGSAGVPDIGFGPIGFSGATGITKGAYDLVTQGNINSAYKKQGQYGILGSLIGAGGGIGAAALLACWVAEELWGPDDDRTHFARYYASVKDTPFTRTYQKHGKEWARRIHEGKIDRKKVEPVWEAMAQAGKELLEKEVC